MRQSARSFEPPRSSATRLPHPRDFSRVPAGSRRVVQQRPREGAALCRISGIVTLSEDQVRWRRSTAAEFIPARYLATTPARAALADIYRHVATTAVPSSAPVCVRAVADGAASSSTTAKVEAVSPMASRRTASDTTRSALLTRTFGEVSDEDKAAVSHRGQAVRAFRDFLTH